MRVIKVERDDVLVVRMRNKEKDAAKILRDLKCLDCAILVQAEQEKEEVFILRNAR